MADIPFSYEDFERTRKELVEKTLSSLTLDDRIFLVSFKEADPIWDYSPFNNISELPAVRWKLQNIEKLKRENPKKHKEMVEALDKSLLS